MSKQLRRIALGALAAAGLCASIAAQGAAVITVINGDPAGVGFNDTTAVAPIGGNPGTTLGEQRLNVYNAVAAKWGSELSSTVEIKVYAVWAALTCTATTAVLGSAGPWDIIRDFGGAPFANTWYAVALANKLSGVDQTPGDPSAADIRDKLGVDIFARFNVNLGNPGCLTGTSFYLGLDNIHGANVDFYTVLLHEVGHGLGFLTFDNQDGSRQDDGTGIGPLPDAWERLMFDNTAGKTWFTMTNAQRAASAVNFRNLAWIGANVTAGAPSVLVPGTPGVSVTSTPVPSASGFYQIGTASFGAILSDPGVTGQLMPVIIQVGGTGPGCNPFNAANTLAAKNNIVLIDRGTCGFAVKAKNAQNAGAVGVIIANNVAGPPPGLGGADPTVVIPTVSVSQADGAKLKAAMMFRSRTTSGVLATIGVKGSQLAGADPAGRVLLYTPNPFQGGSSVSHWDSIAFKNLLMEPAINGDLTHEVKPPNDLTKPLFQDIGW